MLTISAILGMAAHVAELGCSVLDMTGLAQKGGAVTSNVIMANNPAEISSMHVASGGADLILGGDLIVTAGDSVVATAQQGKTKAVVNDYEMMLGEFARISDLRFPSTRLKSRIEQAVGTRNSTFFNANQYVEYLFGDTLTANMFQLGVAFQLGCIPIALPALEKAIELNGKAVELNKLALNRGRQFVAQREILDQEISQIRGSYSADEKVQSRSLEDLIQNRAEFLVQYQNQAYAQRYRDFVETVRNVERQNCAGLSGLTENVAKYYFKLLAYKDEYEVARLFTQSEFRHQLQDQFEGEFKLKFHMAPPILGRKNKVTGQPVKMEFGSWWIYALKLLAKLKFLRGCMFDPFAYSKDHKLEQRLIANYEKTINEVLQDLRVENHSIALEIAAYPRIYSRLWLCERAPCRAN